MKLWKYIMTHIIFNKKLIISFLFLYSSYVYGCENYNRNDIVDILNNYKISEIKEKAENNNGKFQLVWGAINFSGAELDKVKINKDLNKGIYWLKKSSSNNIGTASYILSSAYENGVGVKKDTEKFYFYLKKSAECGFVNAQNKLGHFYTDNKYYKYRSLKKSAYWYEKAAEQGDIDSILTIARFYTEGIGVEKDLSKAFYWLSKGVEQDDGAAELYIAKYYAEGISTKKDLVKAYMMYDLAGTAGVPHKDKLAKQMTPEQIQEAIQKSRQWQEEHHHYRPGYYGLRHQSDGSYQ